LYEDSGYKDAIRQGDLGNFVGSVFRNLPFSLGTNPLDENAKKKTYEAINRDSALHVCEAFASTGKSPANDLHAVRRPFIYLSAEDIFRPIVPARYIETKREAERQITQMLKERPNFREVFIRPSLIYHAHFRPLTTPLAVLFDLSSSLHSKAPKGVPTPSNILRMLDRNFAPSSASSENDVDSSFLSSVANAMVIPPIHVDQVAEAICGSIQDDTVEGVVDVARMRHLIG